MIKVNIGTKTYDLDSHKAMRLGVLTEEITFPPLQTGNTFRHCDGELYILSLVGNMRVALISLGLESNRYVEPVKVKDMEAITEKEWAKLTDGNADRFPKVNVKYTVVS